MLLSMGLQRVSEMTGWLNKTCTYCHFITCFLLIFVVISLFVLLLVSSPVVWDGEGNGKPLQYSCLENPMDGGAWWTAVHGVVKSWTQLSDFTFTFHFHALEKEIATHSSVLAWRIPGMEEPGGLPSMGLHRVGHDWSNLAAAACGLMLFFSVMLMYFSLSGSCIYIEGFYCDYHIVQTCWPVTIPLHFKLIII